MNDDYLWDGRGQPEPDVKRLEEILGQFRQAAPPLAITEAEFEKSRSRVVFPRLRWMWPQLAFAAAAALLIVLATVTWMRHRISGEESGWGVARLDGTPRVGTALVTQEAALAPGQWLETDASSRARIRVSNIGEVVVEPNSRLRLTEARAKHKQLSLARGALTARITAPPWLFYVDTPSATAVDLGCEYTLQVDENGNGLLRVTLGWVQLYDGARQALIPAGAAAKMKHGFGPGTAYFEDTSPEFQSALDALDFGPRDPAARSAALSVVLSQARKQDVLSLFPLLIHVSESDRGRVYDRLAQLKPPPPGVTREGMLRLDQAQVNLWWDEWGLGHPKK